MGSRRRSFTEEYKSSALAFVPDEQRTNRDGLVVAYPQAGAQRATRRRAARSSKVIHSSGRADKVDRDALARLVSSISRFPRPEQAVAAVQGAEIEVLDSRRLGAAWTGA